MAPGGTTPVGGGDPHVLTLQLTLRLTPQGTLPDTVRCAGHRQVPTVSTPNPKR